MPGFLYFQPMNWLFRACGVEPPLLSEPKVDCVRCELKDPLVRAGHYEPKTKCCQFSPFWSAFAIGSYLLKGGDQALISEQMRRGLVLTILGISHSIGHRNQKDSVCENFLGEKGCRIWQHRPPICYSFFCSSQHSDGLLMYGRMEKWLLQVEAGALKMWFDSLGLNEDLWDVWGQYMESDPKITELPEELLIRDPNQAVELYKKSYQALSTEFFREFLVEQGELWEKGLARHPVLC